MKPFTNFFLPFFSFRKKKKEKKSNLAELRDDIAFKAYSIYSQLTSRYHFILFVVILISIYNILYFQSFFFTLL